MASMHLDPVAVDDSSQMFSELDYRLHTDQSGAAFRWQECLKLANPLQS